MRKLNGKVWHCTHSEWCMMLDVVDEYTQHRLLQSVGAFDGNDVFFEPNLTNDELTLLKLRLS